MGRGTESQRAGLRDISRQSGATDIDVLVARYIDRELRRLGVEELRRQVAGISKDYISKAELNARLEGIKQQAIAAVDASAVDATYGTQERDVIISLRDTVTSILAALKSAGVIA